ncbi:DUF4145 domain-containing protein [Paraburkholderia madseniana]|uniref:DUF4145 domain-containing protein n=1 Tax=Paraburkholderia madseniana TaxID=2599607 RepID=A0A6N6W4V2_9BURK|nr:DUF4145 domain-containing protein [Paraburkholderia madseniana]KAE8755635.1 DUF4145 domain-containing protein [Paraburkholderia madseniana]
MFGRFFRNKETGARGETIPARNDGFPDTGTLSGSCPRCKTQSSFESTGAIPVTFSDMTAVGRDGSMTRVPYDRVAVLVCHHCHQGIAVVEEQMTGEHPSASARGGGQIWWRGVHWWPFHGGVSDPAIPAGIQSTFDEACRAIAANCPRAGAVMARRTLEAVAADRGETDGPLVKRLAALASRGLLPSTFSDWAKEVRLVGNIGAHFDLEEDVSARDAEQLRDFIAELLNHLYVLPSKLATRRANANRTAPPSR